MKRYLLLTALALATTAQADFWDNCTAYDGTIITANSYGNDKGGLCNDPNNPELTNNCNGKRFCLGSKLMNWWSAFTWCEAIGGKLADFINVCPGNQILDSGSCPNMKGISNPYRPWTSARWGKDKALALRLWGVGDISALGITTHGVYTMTALCEEK